MAEETKKRGDLGGKKSGKKKSSKKSKKSSGKKVKRIHLRRSATGEMIAEHEHQQDPGAPPVENEEHVVPEGGLDEHVAQHMPAQGEEEEAGAGGGAAMPPGPAAGAMGGM